MKIFAYCRISTKEELKKQSMERQIFTINEFAKKNNFEIDKFYKEDESGKTLNRVEWLKLSQEVVRSGDVIIMTDLDRLGRNADSVIETVKVLKKNNIKLCVLDTPYLNDWNFIMNKDNKDSALYGMTIDILITIKAHVAEQERLKISERTKQALKAKKASGVKLGRPESKNKDAFLKIYPRVKNGDITVIEASKLLGLSRNQFYVLKRKYIKY